MHTVLAARTNFSIGDSILTVEQLVDEAKKTGVNALGITDTMSVTGMIDFTNRCKKNGIKPIIGCRLRLVDDHTWRPVKGVKSRRSEYFVNYYVLSEKGLKALFRLLSLANSSDHFYYVPLLSFDDLYKELDTLSADDVIIASSDVYSVIQHKDAANILQNIKRRVSASNAFLTLSPIDTPYYDSVNIKALELADELGLEVLVTRPVFYDKGEDVAADVMRAIISNNKISEVFTACNFVRDFHVMDEVEFKDVTSKYAENLKRRRGVDAVDRFEEGLQNATKLADLVTYEWKKSAPSLPEMAKDEYAQLVKECIEGWKNRFGGAIFGHKPSKAELDTVYLERLRYELATLKKLGFAGYFLLVQDVVNFAKTNGILVGPGRGSVGGSLVAYLMGITDCDPIRFGLLFERFINPDRIDLPDADLDFMSARRHEVVDYLVSKYGKDKVVGISNFGTLASASSIRDVSRVFELPEVEYSCSKLTPKLHGQPVPLGKAADQVIEIGRFRDKYPDLWKVMLRLEGTMRNLSQHAAGVVVAGCDVTERGFVERRSEGSVVCWDKRIVEEQGLVKMDILGLSNLDLIDLTLRYIRERHSKKINLMQIPLDDRKVLDNFAEGHTVGVFQFESGGMRKLLRELGKDGNITFDDITAATALYRPGPMESGMMDSYYKRKQGIEVVEYDHPLLEPILSPTFGVIVYQEQVMQISRTIAGYSAPDADKLRKIMGKKLPEEMKKERGKFIAGCITTIKCNENWASDLFDKIAGFAGYGFNKSHSVEYSLISWQSMWLKTYYTVEFFAAALTLMDEDRLPAILRDAKRSGIEVDLPDINLSTDRFEILNDTKLSIPLNRIKRVGDKTAAIVASIRNKGGKFKDVEDFKNRIAGNGRYCNKGHIAAFETVGAFASIDPASVPKNDPSRIKNQLELIPGLIDSTVPVHRSMATDKFTKAKLANLIKEYRDKFGPVGDSDGMPVIPTLGTRASIMVVTDAPSRSEDRAGKMAVGDSFKSVEKALEQAGLTKADVYWTSLLKRPKEGKAITKTELDNYEPYLKKEIELLKPPAIVLLGSQVVRQFIPDFKGKASDAAGKIVYSKELDANLIIGFAPGEIYYDGDKQEVLNGVFVEAATLI